MRKVLRVVTLFADYIRLNVGQVEVLTLNSLGCQLLYQKVLDTSGRHYVKSNEPYYKAVPVPSEAIFIKNTEISSLSEELVQAHHQYIRSAAHFKNSTPWKKALSVSVLECVEKICAIQLPRPSYYEEFFGTLQLQKIPEELEETENIYEGAKTQITVNSFERNPLARQRCIEFYGTKCSVCGFDFGEKYGKIAEKFIQVHHLRPISEVGKAYKIDPQKDLRPLCSNCHSVIHMRTPPYNMEEMAEMLSQKELLSRLEDNIEFNPEEKNSPTLW